jgi:hypothetical protein
MLVSRQKLASLGFLRLGLFGLAILDLLLPAVYWLAKTLVGGIAEESLVTVVATLVAPVMAPILLVVIFFDYIMSRLRAADEQGELAAHYRSIHRIELLLIGLMLACWIPYFATL